MSDRVTVSIEGGVADVRLTRPDCGACGVSTASEGPPIDRRALSSSCSASGRVLPWLLVRAPPPTPHTLDLPGPSKLGDPPCPFTADSSQHEHSSRPE